MTANSEFTDEQGRYLAISISYMDKLVEMAGPNPTDDWTEPTENIFLIAGLYSGLANNNLDKVIEHLKILNGRNIIINSYMNYDDFMKVQLEIAKFHYESGGSDAELENLLSTCKVENPLFLYSTTSCRMFLGLGFTNLSQPNQVVDNVSKKEIVEPIEKPNKENKPLIWWLGYIAIVIFSFIYVYPLIKGIAGNRIVTFAIFFGWLYLMDFIWSLVLGYSPRKKEI